MNVQQDTSASYKLLAQSLEPRGYTVSATEETPVMVTFTSPSGAVWTTRASHLAYPFTSDEARRISVQKNLAYTLADKVGFPTPRTLLVADTTDDDELLAMLASSQKLIVKPVDSSLAHGLTLGITSLAALKEAITFAKSFSATVLVQEQVVGEEIRFTVIGGNVKAALLRRTARVIGDGERTIADLITVENKARESLQFDHLAYPQLDESLVDESLLKSSKIPGKGEIVELNHSTMIRGGCSVYDVLTDVHISYLDAVENLVKHLGAGFVVVDVFCRSYKEPAAVGNYWFIEFNTAPVLKLYYSCRDGNHFDIATHLADAIDKQLHAISN